MFNLKFKTYNEAVEKLVHHQTQNADCDVANRVDEIKVSKYLSPWLSKCAMVAHHTDGQNNTIHYLKQHSKYDIQCNVSCQYSVEHNTCKTHITACIYISQ